MNIEVIGNNCFYGCTSLTTINIRTSVSEIGYKCYEGCPNELKKNEVLKKIYYNDEYVIV
ncbi:leucine rich repeatcontaining protein [Entamoeba histolytica KU27]|uniref:Leucine rich repeatcontaining protein n=1 Tax=Entamoeba histolytica KU27 TaxID=885311 RepID=M2RHA2_ENTHI|nr:leucine rich repeatcontaining protein [Entamoeba histolytica KU27]